MKALIIIVLPFLLVGCSGDFSDFKNQTLQGKLNGDSWQATHVGSQVMDYGTHKKEKFSIYSEQCESYECFSLKSPSINISNLDVSNDNGGKFTLNNNITIFNPPSENLIVIQGSYIVSKEGGKTKLELNFSSDNDNFLNGYVVY